MLKLTVLAALALASPAWGQSGGDPEVFGTHGSCKPGWIVTNDHPHICTRTSDGMIEGILPQSPMIQKQDSGHIATPVCPTDHHLFAITNYDRREFEHVLFVWPENGWALV